MTSYDKIPHRRPEKTSMGVCCSRHGCFSRIETQRADLLTLRCKAADVFHHSRGVSFTLLSNNNLRLLLALCEGFLFQNVLADGLSEPELRDRVPAYQVRLVIVSQR